MRRSSSPVAQPAAAPVVSPATARNDGYAAQGGGRLLAVSGLDVDIGGVCVAAKLDLGLDSGQRLVILGRNGAGKTTLLHTLAGMRQPRRGRIELCGTRLDALDGQRMARLRGLLTQHHLDAFPATVLETALTGRHPHLGRWSWESAADEHIARAALAAVGLGDLAGRDVHTLSGGERQRLAIAALLAQQPLLYLLDEPLAHLDLNHQIAVLELLSQRARRDGVGIIMVLHDINLALRYGDRALLLFGDGSTQEGPVDEVLKAEGLSRLYGHPLREIRDGGARYFVPR